MTKEGEIRILIIMKREPSIINVFLKYLHICSLFSIICYYYVATFTIFYAYHFLAMIELKGSLTTIHS